MAPGPGSRAPGPATKLARQGWDLRFSDGPLEQAYQAYQKQLVNSSFESTCLVFVSIVQLLVLRRQWGVVGLFDQVVIVLGSLVPLVAEAYHRMCPDAYMKRRSVLRSFIKVFSLHVTRRVSTHGSRVPLLRDGWWHFFLYTSLYGRFLAVAISVLFLQVGFALELRVLAVTLPALVATVPIMCADKAIVDNEAASRMFAHMAKYMSVVDMLFPYAGVGTSTSMPLEVTCSMVLAFQQIIFGAVGPLFLVYCQEYKSRRHFALTRGHCEVRELNGDLLHRMLVLLLLCAAVSWKVLEVVAVLTPGVCAAPPIRPAPS